MDSEQREGLAALRVLTCVARADGRLKEGERAALEAAARALPGEVDLDALLQAHVSLEEELAVLDTRALRQQVHDAAFVMAHADGAPSEAELALLERILPEEGEATLVQQVLGETRDTFLPTGIKPIHDPEQRDVEVREDTLKYAVLCASLGALPIPGVTILTDLAVVGFQVKLVRDIGQYYGHQMDEQAARSLLGGVVGSAGMRVALNNLARFVPGWGSLFGAVTSFATTIAVGRVAERYFASGGALSAEELRATYESAVKEGEADFAAHKARVEAETERRRGAQAT
ncbi:MAG: YcjF family protein [Myxococcota bacterium]